MREPTSSPANPLHVAVGVIVDAEQRVLVSRRHAHSHQGKLWEFPGGKLEAGEPVQAGLEREFREELGLQLHRYFPVKKILYQYPEKTVLLDVWQITEYSGSATGLEGQAVQWRSITALDQADFPPADVSIIRLLKLPREIAITPVLDNESQLTGLIADYVALQEQVIQLRQHQLDPATYRQWFELASDICTSQGVTLIFNNDPKIFATLEKQAAFHASSARLMQLNARPVAEDLLFSVSCHNQHELLHAEALNADFAFLSPVKPTDKYLPGHCLNWAGFEELAGQVSLPVYALGGMIRSDIDTACQHGAMGIAGIRCFLP
ncbi:MAG TPA: Nudix family hydrolase [Gammaproteobacteria bacterium]|nr:Nudix family hydrolase [Gammaproteobacteria bacterium]